MPCSGLGVIRKKPDIRYKPLDAIERLPEVQRAKHRMQLSYTGRMLLLVAVAIVALTAPCFHPVAAALALLFPRLVIFIQGFVKPKNKEA